MYPGPSAQHCWHPSRNGPACPHLDIVILLFLVSSIRILAAVPHLVKPSSVLMPCRRHPQPAQPLLVGLVSSAEHSADEMTRLRKAIFMTKAPLDTARHLQEPKQHQLTTPSAMHPG
ncbi:hypothetical protein BD414DRAFT_61937 [Trametes punicea]|nr:hypothetical protein BD414DRAFT_61937 [Trametes punicea]